MLDRRGDEIGFRGHRLVCLANCSIFVSVSGARWWFQPALMWDFTSSIESGW